MNENNYDEAIQSVDKILKPLLIIAAIYAIIAITIMLWKSSIVANRIDENIQQTQTVINNNQAGALEARKQNIQRQKDLNGYIKCLVLLRYDRPDITPASSRQDTESALDNCAKSTAE